MQEFRNFIDIMIIKYNKDTNELWYETHGSPDLKPVFQRYFEMFCEAFDFSKNIILPLCVNDSGCWYENVINIADFKDKACMCFPYHDYLYDKDFDEKCKSLQNLGDEPYVYDKLLWIGSLFEHGPDSRKEFCKIKNDRIVNIDSLTSNIYISHEDHTKYRYLIDIEGGFLEKTGYSRRNVFFPHMKRLLFFVDRPIYSFFDYKLEPWIHYVPVKRDFSDLFEKIKWADDHQEESKQIIQNMLKIAPSRQDAIDQIKKIIHSI